MRQPPSNGDGVDFSTAKAPVASPCTLVCQLDPVSGYCQGCHRTMTEISAWPALTDEEKLRILAQLPQRQVTTP